MGPSTKQVAARVYVGYTQAQSCTQWGGSSPILGVQTEQIPIAMFWNSSCLPFTKALGRTEEEPKTKRPP